MIRRIFLAFRVFFVTLFSSLTAQQVAEVLDRRKAGKKALTGAAETTIAKESGTAGPAVAKEPKKVAAPKPPAHSEAITLLAALQREARFVDFIQEPLTGYTDAQIGAVARDVHRDCGSVLERMFALQPAMAEEEGKTIEVPIGFDAGRFRLTGNVTGDPPFRGRLVHPGWEAAKCELPTWAGTAGSARIIAPAEIELP